MAAAMQIADEAKRERDAAQARVAELEANIQAAASRAVEELDAGMAAASAIAEEARRERDAALERAAFLEQVLEMRRDTESGDG